MYTATLGFPRIGRDRELKRAVESMWRGRISADELVEVARGLRLQHWQLQAAAGVDFIPSHDFALYDHVLDHVVMFGAIPDGYGWRGGETSLDTYFALARGTDDAPALEMTKWFNTNYHYISARLDGHFTLTENRPLRAYLEARAAGIETRPVLVGPYTFLKLANNPGALSIESLAASLAPLYVEVLAGLAQAGAAWVQMDEPALVQEPTAAELDVVAAVYAALDTGRRPRIMLQTYFDDIAHSWDEVMQLPVDGVGLDFIHGPENLDALAAQGFPEDKALGIGLVDGRSVWRTDLARALDKLDTIGKHTDLSRAILGPSCSLLHLPFSAADESELDPAIKSWLAFATERVEELGVLRGAARDGRDSVATQLAANAALHAARHADPRTRVAAVRSRAAAVGEAEARRGAPAPARLALQQTRLGLPPLPTTTIGSFPQTTEVRKARAHHQKGEWTDAEYDAFLDEQFRQVIALQEELGLDVLVHGEFERSDMVDYFAQQLDGMAFINGWVQSYGTRCVRPPVIYGDIQRRHPMTVEVIARVQALTERPLKGMLTGPVTMLLWSFRRDDLAPRDVALQLALAIRDEVTDLEAAGVKIIQIDEPALREGLPLQRADWGAYLDWATRAFRVSASGVRDDTQIHTHMCYSEFNEIMPAIGALDADVISIESSRSGGELLTAFRDFEYDKGIGPGVYDVHSERVPDAAEVRELIKSAAAVIDPTLLWVNPDCGLKTREYGEAVAALRNMVEAAQAVRAELFAAEPV